MKENLKNHKHFLAAMYLRLSRDDHATKGGSIPKGGSSAKNGTAVKRNRAARVGIPAAGGSMADPAGIKPESNSITSQREFIRAYIQGQPDIELYDVYVDDAAIIGLNQKTFYFRGLPIKSYFYTLFTQTQLLSSLIYHERSRNEWQKL